MFDDDTTIDGRWIPQALGLLRIVTALLFLEHGTSKILGFPLTQISEPPVWSLYWVAGVLELFGSLFVLAGLFTRPVAFLLAGEMAIGYWMIHAPTSPFPVVNKGDAAILFCFVFLLFTATGPGAWSLERRLRQPPRIAGDDDPA